MLGAQDLWVDLEAQFSDGADVLRESIHRNYNKFHDLQGSVGLRAMISALKSCTCDEKVSELFF